MDAQILPSRPRDAHAAARDARSNLQTVAATVASHETLATLGEGHIAYVKQIRSEDVPGLFPEAPKIAPGLKLFALHSADGTPIMLTDSREAAVANAWSNELQAVSVH